MKTKRPESPGLLFGFSFFYGGGKESRTPDLLNAIQTLYQLSYTPEEGMHIIYQSPKPCGKTFLQKRDFFAERPFGGRKRGRSPRGIMRGETLWRDFGRFAVRALGADALSAVVL